MEQMSEHPLFMHLRVLVSQRVECSCRVVNIANTLRGPCRQRIQRPLRVLFLSSLNVKLLHTCHHPKVIHRPTEGLYRVLRWTAEDAIMLLQPIVLVAQNQDEGGPPGNRQQNPTPTGTRWAFEKDVVLIEKPPTPTPREGGSKQQKYKQRREQQRQQQRPTPGKGNTCGAGEMKPRQLHSRFLIRSDPKKGRGVYALEDVPGGTEVMRVRGVATTVKSTSRRNVCGICFADLPGNEGSAECKLAESCPICKSVFCVKCANRRDFWNSVPIQMHRETCHFVATLQRAPLGPNVDTEILAMVADFLARKKRGFVDDQELEVIEALQRSRDTSGADDLKILSAGEVGEVVRRLNVTVQSNISEDEVQAMYSRRATRLTVEEVCIFAAVSHGEIGEKL